MKPAPWGLRGSRRAVLAIASCCILLPGGASAQGADTLHIYRLSSPIVLDGVPNEPEWDSIPPLPLTAFTPVFRGPLTERTEIRLAYDQTYFYVAGRMHETEPRRIRIQSLYRDGAMGDDLLGVLLDTYNDRQTASWFVVNPAGVRTDRALSNDGEFTQGQEPMNPNWNAFWDVRTARTPDGWSAEMRIPFSSLGFQDVNGRVLMGISVYRVVARRNERQIFPATSPDYGPFAFAKPSRFRPIVLEGVHSHRPVYARPYALGGASRAAELNAPGTAYGFATDVTHEVGLDVRLSPTSNLTLDLTANTDFAQVEADDQQINLTRFSLFFPEKRQFFQERSSLFDFGTGDLTRLFHSRQIGLVDGAPIRLLGGVRLVGRLGQSDFGLIDMQSAAERGLQTENLGVVRLRRQVFNPYSTIGAMVTGRISDSTYNVGTGIDAVLRPFGDQYVTLKWAQTFDGGAPGLTLGDLAATRLFARWERRNQSGFRYTEELIRSGAGYQPKLGFTIRNDFTSSETRLQYLWFGAPRAPYRTFAVQAASKGYLRNTDHTVESALIEGGFDSELKGGQQLTLTYRTTFESLRDTFALSGGTTVFPADYWFGEGELRYMASRQARIRPSFTATAGAFYDGHRFSLQANPAWNPSSHLELGVDYLFNAIRFPRRGVAADLHVARVRIQAAYDAHLSLSTFLQYNGSTNTASVNARLRYNFREGNDLWVVYNETANTDRAALLPEPPFSQSRALMVKYTYTLIW